MVVDWEQETGLLMSSGDVRIVRIWDTDREMKVQVTMWVSPKPQACGAVCAGLVLITEPSTVCGEAWPSRGRRQGLEGQCWAMLGADMGCLTPVDAGEPQRSAPR